MDEHVTLSEAERGLLAELLEQELHELPVEIRHTRSATVRQELHERLAVVRGLLQRFREPVPV
jgi:hypothetical protein